mmetsp:Transcript_3555/g.6739  ORF Transcript_3555/g.6739 Transcript_3555/m.6739 type:complete len:383 (-) Transcript_3555:2739-3887(-)
MSFAFALCCPLRHSSRLVRDGVSEVRRSRRVLAGSSRTFSRLTSALGAEDIISFSRAQRDYLEQVAAWDAPPLLEGLVAALASEPGQDVRLVIPDEGVRSTLHPFFIPLGEVIPHQGDEEDDNSYQIGYLRWPTPPEGFELPVVRTSRKGTQIALLASSTKAFLGRVLARADSSGNEQWFENIVRFGNLDESWVDQELYRKGAVNDSGFGLEQFLILNLGPSFPDVYEGLASFHEAKGDPKSALITMERAGQAFPGWARSHCFRARMLQRMGRDSEARDAARFSLQLPLWTLNDDVEYIARLAGYEEPASLGKIYRNLARDERLEEIQGGKRPEQVALDRAAYLLDAVIANSLDLSWKQVRDELVKRYNEARMPEIARFVAG